MSKNFLTYLSISLTTLILVSLSFVIRLNILSLVDKYGFVIGEIWIFYKRYGNHQIFDFFYSIEYPVGFVLIQKIVLIVNTIFFRTFNYQTFVLSHAFIMLPIAILLVSIVYYLANLLRINKFLSICYILLSPTFFLASTTNYDLFPTFFVILAILLIIKNKTYFAFLSLALGTVIKLFPFFLLPVFILFAHSKGIKTIQIKKSLLIFVVTVLVINLPYMLNNFSLWTFPYLFQLQNPQRNDPNTLSYFIGTAGFKELRPLLSLVFIFISWLVAYLFYKHRVMNNKNFILLLYLTTFSIIFANHVYTPQYMLWFIPFVALTNSPSLVIWLAIDFINSSVLFFNAKLVLEDRQTLKTIFDLMLISFTFLYANLIYKVKGALEKSQTEK